MLSIKLGQLLLLAATAALLLAGRLGRGARLAATPEQQLEQQRRQLEQWRPPSQPGELVAQQLRSLLASFESYESRPAPARLRSEPAEAADMDTDSDADSDTIEDADPDDGQESSSIPSGQQADDKHQLATCPPDYDDSLMVLDETNPDETNQTTSALLINQTQTQTQSQTQLRQRLACVPGPNRTIEVITKVITPILFSVIILVGLIGNIVVMLVILEDKKTDRELTPPNLLILDLSLADLSFIIFCIPFTAWDYSVGHWVFGSIWCKLNQYLIVVCALSSIYTLVLMSVDRFMAIVYPIQCLPYRTSTNTLYAIYIKWAVILVAATPVMRMHGLLDLPPAPDQYTCRFLEQEFNPLHFQIVFFVTSYLFPLILIFCLYLSLLNKLWFGTKPQGHKESLKTLESKKKVTWLVAGIVIVFAICWCPIQVMLILMRLKIHKITVTYIAIQVFAHTLGYMNSCTNPIVYAFASETFNNSFKRSSLGRLFRRCCPCWLGPASDLDRTTQTSATYRSANTLNNNNNNSYLLANQSHSVCIGAEHSGGGSRQMYRASDGGLCHNLDGSHVFINSTSNGAGRSLNQDDNNRCAIQKTLSFKMPTRVASFAQYRQEQQQQHQQASSRLQSGTGIDKHPEEPPAVAAATGASSQAVANKQDSAGGGQTGKPAIDKPASSNNNNPVHL